MKFSLSSLTVLILLWFPGLLLTGGCTVPSKANGSVSPSTAVQSSTPPLSSLTPLTAQRIEQGAFTVLQYPNEPVALLDLQLVGADRPRQAELLMQFQNVSGKKVKLVVYGIGVSQSCTEFMYSMVPTPSIGYGDWSLRGYGEKGNPAEPPLGPGQRASIRLANDKDLPPFLNPKTYASCSKEDKKPQFMLEQVYLDDGTVWSANEHK